MKTLPTFRLACSEMHHKDQLEFWAEHDAQFALWLTPKRGALLRKLYMDVGIASPTIH